MRIFLLMLAFLAPLNVQAAIRVINNSAEVQTVHFYFAGHTESKALAVNESVFFWGSDGMLGIDVAKQTIKATDAKVGTLSKILGGVAAGNRTSGIPARDGDVFMIWPDGRLLFQQRQRNRGGSTF